METRGFCVSVSPGAQPFLEQIENSAEALQDYGISVVKVNGDEEWDRLFLQILSAGLPAGWAEPPWGLTAVAPHKKADGGRPGHPILSLALALHLLLVGCITLSACRTWAGSCVPERLNVVPVSPNIARQKTSSAVGQAGAALSCSWPASSVSVDEPVHFDLHSWV